MTLQRKIGSVFGPRSSAADVLDGIDLSGKLALVTGGYSGLGVEATRALATAGARVIVPARRVAQARKAIDDIDGAEAYALDLADLDSVHAFADRLLAARTSIDIVITGAGIMACPETRVGPGWEAQFGVNHLGHYALVNRLWPAIADEARVVAVSSAGHQLSGIRWADPHFTTGYDRWLAYAQSKTANALFAVELDRRGSNRGIHAFSLHPGAILTPLLRHMSTAEKVDRGWIDHHGNLIDPNFKTPQQGAATQVWAATSPLLTRLGGAYCEDCDVAEPTDSTEMISGVREYAIDPDQAARLWELSARHTGLDLIPS